MEIPFLKDKNGYFIRVHVKTGAKSSEIEGVEKDTVKVKVKAQPHDGQANKELIELLSEYLGVAKSKLEISKGTTSKNKIIRIKGDLA